MKICDTFGIILGIIQNEFNFIISVFVQLIPFQVQAQHLNRKITTAPPRLALLGMNSIEIYNTIAFNHSIERGTLHSQKN